MYDKVDAMYTSNPERVLKAYHKLPRVKILAARNPEVAYYLDKIATYIHGKLFVFNEQPQFVCFNNYVQQDDTVEVNYTISDTAWNMLATSLADVAKEFWIASQNMLAFNAWSENVMQWFNTAVLWTQLEKQNSIIAEPNDAWWSYDTSKRITFTNDIPETLNDGKVGQQVLMNITIDGSQEALLWVITEKTTNAITVDFNHPHAGKTVQIGVQIAKLFKACN